MDEQSQSSGLAVPAFLRNAANAAPIAHDSNRTASAAVPDAGSGSTPTPAATSDATGGPAPFIFTGKAGEFFAIWIVNICLTVLTLGIYSAWAKVRTRRYFYGNTRLADSSFDYLADPVKILKGRMVAAGLFAVYYFGSGLDPVIGAVCMTLIMAAAPAILVMGFSFSMINSAYRNVRFGFERDFRGAYRIFAVPVLVVLAWFLIAIQFAPELDPVTGKFVEEPSPLFLALTVVAAFFPFFLPWIEYRLIHFRMNFSRYGQTGFAWQEGLRKLYGIYGKAFLGLLLVLVIIGVVMAFALPKAMAGGNDPAQNVENVKAMSGWITVAVWFLLLPAYLWAFAYIKAAKFNYVINATTIGGNRLRGEMKVGKVLFLYVTNTLAILFTLGLAIPWSLIRTAKYAASVTTLDVADLDSFVRAEEQQQNAIGEEIGDMFDIDLGF